MALSRTAYGPYPATPPQGTGAFVTGSFTPPSSSLLVVIVLFSNEGTAVTGDTGYVLTGGGHTWTKRTSFNHEFSAANCYNVQIWTAPVTTGASMALTLTHTGINSYSGYIFPYAYTGHNAASPVGGVAANTGATGTNTLTLSSAPAADSDVLAGIVVITNNSDGSDATITAGSGFTLIGSPQYATNAFAKAQTEVRTGSTSDQVTFTTTTGAGSPFNARVFGAIEIKAAGGTVESVAAAFSGAGAFNAAGATVVARAGAFPGVGTLNASGATVVARAASFTGIGTLNASGATRVDRAAAFSGVGALSAGAAARVDRAAAFAGIGTLGAASAIAVASAASFSGVGTLNAASAVEGGSTESVAAAFSGVGVFAPVAATVVAVAVTFSGSGTFAPVATGGLDLPAPTIDLGGAGAGAWVHPDQLIKKKSKREQRRYYLNGIPLSNQQPSIGGELMNYPIGRALTETEARKLEQEMQAESDLRTVIEAEKIKSSPERMSRLQAKLSAAKQTLEDLKGS